MMALDQLQSHADATAAWKQVLAHTDFILADLRAREVLGDDARASSGANHFGHVEFYIWNVLLTEHFFQWRESHRRLSSLRGSCL